MVSLPKEFRANLESYSGPLDLLLFLIKKEEVDVFNIPVAHLVEQYKIYLEVLVEVDPNACGEFLVMAARLMEIKSKLLLPREILEEGEEDLDDPRIELVRQLLEYKKFKERALLLERRLDSHSRRHRRPRLDLPVGENPDETPLELGSIGVWDLLTAFHRIQIALGQRGPHQVVMEERPQEEYIEDIIIKLESSVGSELTLFDDLFVAARNRHEAVSYLLAVLQLAKEYRLILSQEMRPEGHFLFVALRSEEDAQRLRELELGDSSLGDGDSDDGGSLEEEDEDRLVIEAAALSSEDDGSDEATDDEDETAMDAAEALDVQRTNGVELEDFALRTETGTPEDVRDEDANR